MLKIKSLIAASLLASAMLFSLAACKTDAESSSNELAGKSFYFSDEWGTEALSFTDDTFTITSTRP